MRDGVDGGAQLALVGGFLAAQFQVFTDDGVAVFLQRALEHGVAGIGSQGLVDERGQRVDERVAHCAIGRLGRSVGGLQRFDGARQPCDGAVRIGLRDGARAGRAVLR